MPHCLRLKNLLTKTKMNIISNNTLLLRLAVSTILIVHGVGGMFNGGINGFGQALNEWGIGLAPLGVPIAWAIKWRLFG
jgi:uncharacterized membrane protein YphA (DoxX/SURF4 family)